MADSFFTYEGIWIRKKVNNSEEMVGAVLDDYVSGTFDSDGMTTVNTKLKNILCHSLGYGSLTDATAPASAIAVNYDVTIGSDGAPNTVTVYGTASRAFNGFLTGRAVEN